MAKKDHQTARGSNGQAEASRKSERAKIQMKAADQQAEHAVEHEVDEAQDVMETISLSNKMVIVQV